MWVSNTHTQVSCTFSFSLIFCDLWIVWYCPPSSHYTIITNLFIARTSVFYRLGLNTAEPTAPPSVLITGRQLTGKQHYLRDITTVYGMYGVQWADYLRRWGRGFVFFLTFSWVHDGIVQHRGHAACQSCREEIWTTLKPQNEVYFLNMKINSWSLLWISISNIGFNLSNHRVRAASHSFVSFVWFIGQFITSRQFRISFILQNMCKY